MKKIIFISLLIFSTFWSCSKVDLPTSNEAIFYLAGSLNDSIFNWKAGFDGNYMLAKVDTTPMSQLFVGNLGQILTPFSNRFPSLEIIFVKSNLDLSGVNSTLSVGDFQYATADSSQTKYFLSYSAQNSIGSTLLKYNFNFLNFNSMLVSEKFDITNLNAQGLASLEIKNSLGTVSNQNMYVNLPQNKFINVEIVQSPNKILKAEVFGDIPTLIVWSNGDSTQTTNIDSFTNNYSVSATLSNNQVISSSIVLNSNNQPSLQAKLNLDLLSVTDSLPVSNYESQHIIVRYVDNNGQLFSSEWGVQTINDLFKVIFVEDFDRNEAGIKTKKMEVLFSCRLRNSQLNKEIVFRNVAGMIAVGVPD